MNQEKEMHYGNEKSYYLKLDSNMLPFALVRNKFKDIDKTDRVLLGALAGRARLQSQLALYDTASGKLLAKANAESESSGGSVLAGTSPQAVEQMAGQVIQFLKENL